MNKHHLHLPCDYHERPSSFKSPPNVQNLVRGLYMYMPQRFVQGVTHSFKPSAESFVHLREIWETPFTKLGIPEYYIIDIRFNVYSSRTCSLYSSQTSRMEQIYLEHRHFYLQNVIKIDWL